MLEGEKWWGLCNNFGRDMPFAEESAFACDLKIANYGHQSLSFLWFPPTGEEPELLYFAASQYNTWLELTYHQNEKHILA